MSEIEKLKAQNAELNDRIAKLEEAAKPPKPFVPMPSLRRDLTEGAVMPASALKAMLDAVPESVMRDLCADARKPNPVTTGSSQITSTPAALPQKRGTGWAPEVPLGPPPGIDLCDRLVDAQDANDRAELALKLAKLGKAE